MKYVGDEIIQFLHKTTPMPDVHITSEIESRDSGGGFWEVLLLIVAALVGAGAGTLLAILFVQFFF